jgi:DNA gyrase subunit A
VAAKQGTLLDIDDTGGGLTITTGFEEEFPLSDELRKRYLSYALSVITCRALPDVRDGLKPVQRRILYAMYSGLGLRSGAKPRKSAAVVGEVLGKYHPHGDAAAYEAMVRMAQGWVMRYPLVHGEGNFGSNDGDNPAAMRYTEAKLTKIADELLGEIGSETVLFRDNYDGTTTEPTVLPSRFPNLLVNGSYGIAVGMSTSIPPHNLTEVIAAAVALIDDPELSIEDLMKYIQGPDFPTAGVLTVSREEMLKIYTEGQGSFRLRGEYRLESGKRGRKHLILTSIPYSVTKGSLVEKIGELIFARKIPQIDDVRDESTDDVRVVLDLKSGADADQAMAYLFKHTALATNISANFTVLVPGEKEGSLHPVNRVDLKSMLSYYLDFRLETIRRRTQYELRCLEKRIHLLEGFRKVFDALTEVLRLIRKSDGKADAATKLIRKIGLDPIQAEAVLELKLYKIARLEIKIILEELERKSREADKLRRLLGSEKRLWSLVKKELEIVSKEYGDARKTHFDAEELPEFDPDAYIVEEQTFVILTEGGWAKRQGAIREVSSIRVRAGDRVQRIVSGSTKEHVAFFSSAGKVYVLRANDIPATTGHGQSVSKLFKLKDGERIVALYSYDPKSNPPEWLLTVSKKGYGFQFATELHLEPTSRSGRRYARPTKGDEILGVVPVEGGEVIITASRSGRALLCPLDEVSDLTGPGKGVIIHKLGREDELVGFCVTDSERKGLVVETGRGAQQRITPARYRVSSRAGKGFELIKRGTIEKTVPVPVEIP